jgi:GTPase SAR1 family protein
MPGEVAQLTSLTVLDLSANRLRALPPEIAQLTSLRTLTLAGNQLSLLPPEISQLTNLTALDLSGNELATLPSEIGRLRNLQRLWLNGNRLTGLPPEISQLPRLQELRLADNPLDETMTSFLEPDGYATAALFVYLRSLLDDTELQYEGKLLLVGEGDVGKTCLVDALSGRGCQQEPKPTTHGVQIEALSFRHPEADRSITLNTWDFGGQEIYRITHQFFFSPRSLFLLVWKPRAGQDQNEVEAWLRRIRLRVGQDARVLLVATHADENRNPEIDYPRLETEFGPILAGQYFVDSVSGSGIDGLRTAIAREAAGLPGMGKPVNRRWLAARNEVLTLATPQITFQEFLGRCAHQGMEGDEAEALARLLHELGHVIHYADVEGLGEIVVLQPEWLTKAISYVLEDVPTRRVDGVLDHRRLRVIWGGSWERAYPAHYHPYFLRLMEQFDICYRLPGEDGSSLVAQLVPYERPVLAWDGAVQRPGVRSLKLICRMSDEAPGLIAWLTVRNHRFSTGRHWRSGVFLRHARYGSEGLFELTSGRQLLLTVRAGSPDAFFAILRDSLEDLIAQRWHLTYELLVPCPAMLEDGRTCPGSFNLETLFRRREAGRTSIDCHWCDREQEIGVLLTGFATPLGPQAPELEQIGTQLRELEVTLRQTHAGVQRTEVLLAIMGNEVRNVLKIVSAEVSDCPRLFSLTPSSSKWRKAHFWQETYTLTLWCEHPDHWHPYREASYEIKRPEEWFREVAPYLRMVSRLLRLVVPLLSGVGELAASRETIERLHYDIEGMEKVADAIPEFLEGSLDKPLATVAGPVGSGGAGLRVFRSLLLEVDPARRFAGMGRVRNGSGDFLWVCPTNYREYDPGLPQLP